MTEGNFNICWNVALMVSNRVSQISRCAAMTANNKEEVLYVHAESICVLVNSKTKAKVVMTVIRLI